MTKYKIKPFDEVNNIYLLYRKQWWIFYSFVSAGSKEVLQDFVTKHKGVLV